VSLILNGLADPLEIVSTQCVNFLKQWLLRLAVRKPAETLSPLDVGQALRELDLPSLCAEPRLAQALNLYVRDVVFTVFKDTTVVQYLQEPLVPRGFQGELNDSVCIDILQNMYLRNIMLALIFNNEWTSKLRMKDIRLPSVDQVVSLLESLHRGSSPISGSLTTMLTYQCLSLLQHHVYAATFREGETDLSAVVSLVRDVATTLRDFYLDFEVEPAVAKALDGHYHTPADLPWREELQALQPFL